MIKIKFLARKVLYYNLILQALFHSARHIYQKREGSGSGMTKHLRIRIQNTSNTVTRSPFFLVTRFLDSHVILSFSCSLFFSFPKKIKH